MPDPHVLYTVMGTVTSGLVLWVLFVLVRFPSSAPSARADSPRAEPAKPEAP